MQHHFGFRHLVSDLFATAKNRFRSTHQTMIERLAVGDILIGTSSWKYPEWCGLLHNEQRYCYRGKFAAFLCPLPLCDSRLPHAMWNEVLLMCGRSQPMGISFKAPRAICYTSAALAQSRSILSA